MVYLISQLTIGSLMKLFIEKIDGKNNIITDKPFIIACNHASYIDDFAVPSVFYPAINRKFHFYVNSSYFKNFFLRMVLNYYESIPVDVDRGNHHKQVNKKAFETASRYLKRGDVIFIFPEGTRSIDGRLQRAKTGIAKLAIAAKVPVQPVGIIGSNRILPKGKFFPRPARCRINIGNQLYFKDYYNKKINKKMLEDVTRKIMKEIAKLVGQKYNY